MNTQENNKLIAEFMGLSIKEGVSYYTDENDMFPMNVEVKGVHLPYDTDWNWLMPVHRKCMFTPNFSGDDQLRTLLIDAVIDADINRLYDAVLEFIKQYNK